MLSRQSLIPVFVSMFSLLVACNAQGPQGNKGDDGEKGERGKRGNDGRSFDPDDMVTVTEGTLFVAEHPTVDVVCPDEHPNLVSGGCDVSSGGVLAGSYPFEDTETSLAGWRCVVGAEDIIDYAEEYENGQRVILSLKAVAVCL